MFKYFKLIVLIIFAISLTGCNIFSWTHKAGSDANDTVSLTTDGDSALYSADYVGAMDYYDKAIASDPTNSKARYGYVNAYIKNTGLNIVELAKNTGNFKTIANLVPGLVSHKAGTYKLIDDPSKPFGIDIKTFENLAIVLVDKLEPIAKGETDNKISPNDPEMNLNLALGHFLRAVLIVADPPDGNSGKLMYNARHNDDNTFSMIYLDGTDVPCYISLQGRNKALAEFSLALTRLTTAIDNSVAKSSTWWSRAKESILQMKYSLEQYFSEG
jgi:tetratricopeptide (TPR) repeat protein